ncbi:MAG: GTP-binding protein Era [Chlorobi bacterium OLB4]|jgi:GTP-binding protein Era|nr:MAG: GTP-binding protein Era [Chlorobi bacterium OLB4]MBW7855646.1 GTPase Era [Ignavibacteria bacterium]OQY79129.1 MAG: GTPase Era [Ignavibacteriales bacterium UTCHB1]
MTKCGYVAILGIPNAGKSTLMNKIIGVDLSIVTHKPQTTRNKITGIYTDRDSQIIILDTPGIIEPKYELQSYMMKEVSSSVNDADTVIHLIDITQPRLQDQLIIIEPYRDFLRRKKTLTVLNKIDEISQSELERKISEISGKSLNDELIPVSAKYHFNIKKLIEEIKSSLPESNFLFEPDELTNRPERFFVAEIIREKILELFEEEIPYSVFVEITEFKDRKGNGSFISADIILDRETQKAIIIGKFGSALKQLGTTARISIEQFLSRKVYLDLFVKVRKNWRKNESFLKRKF